MRERKIKESIVSITRCDNEQNSLVEALDLLPVKDIVNENHKVVITPNWVGKKHPSSATIVGPDTLRELIRYIKRFKPKQIIVATGSGGEETSNIFHAFGYDLVIEEEDVEFIDLNYGPYTDIILEHDIIPSTKINKLYNEMDVLISFTQLKQHEEATVSASVKNMALGWPPAEIHGFPKKNTGIHDDLHGFIIAMAKQLPIDLAIVSADKAMIATGPSDGLAVDTKGLIIAATDPVAADAIGARLLGFLPQAVHYIYQLNKLKIGEADPSRMILRGVPLYDAEKMFSRAAYKTEVTLDKKDYIKGLHAQ